MKSFITRRLLLAAALLAGLDAGAQKMITFESRPADRSAHHRRRQEEGKNSLTLGIASAVNGYTPLYYERTVASFLTVQAGAGITYRSYLNDLGAMIYSDGAQSSDQFNGGLYADVEDDYAAYRFRKMRIGQYFSLSPKFYLRADPLDGGYIGPMIEYKNYQYKARMADETVSADTWRRLNNNEQDIPRSARYTNERMRCLDLTFQVGGHFQTRSHIAVGWNVGLGARMLAAERLDIGIVRDSYDMSSDSHFVNATRSFTATRPLFVFNFMMGGWF